MAEYKRQHFVPQSYLKSWEDSSGRIWLYRKKDEDLIKSSSVDSSLFLKDFYTLGTNELLALSNDDLEYLFSGLTDKRIWLNGKKIDSYEKLIENYSLNKEWEIYDFNNMKLSTKKIINEIEGKRILRLEKGWHQIENTWNELCENVSLFVNGDLTNIGNNVKESLIDFIIGQMWRVPKTEERVFDLIHNLFTKLEIPVDGNIEFFNELMKELSRTYFLKNVDKFQNRSSEFVFNEMYEKFHNYTQFVFYKAIGRKKFYTSDNPVFININPDFLKGKFNGLFFPISPDVLLVVYKGNKESIDVVAELTENTVRKINRKIVNNSFRKFVVNKEL